MRDNRPNCPVCHRMARTCADTRRITDHARMVAFVNVEDMWPLLLQSVRYAMGRQSYAVGECCRMVRMYAGHLTAGQVAQIGREIAEGLLVASLAGNTLGMDMDDREWRSLVVWCDAHVEARKGGEG